MTQVHDNNLFFAPGGGESDFITRVTPAIDGQYRSPVWTLTGRYAFDAERFLEHVDLNRGLARQRALTGIDYRRSERTRLALTAAFSTTQTPGELMRETGLGFVRASAQRLEGTWSMARQVSPLTASHLGYAFSEDRIEGGPAVRTQTLMLGADKRLSERTVFNAGYRVRQFTFGSTPLLSQAISLGWSRAITAHTALSISGGPNVTDGTPSVDVETTLRGRMNAVNIAVTYARAQTTVFGLPGVVQAESLGAMATWAPSRSVQFQFAPAIYRSSHGELQADVVRGIAALRYSITPGVAVEVSFDGSEQRGLLFTELANQRIPRYETMIRLVAGSAPSSR